ncbi:hypothetical protein [Rhizobium sp.]|uniref:hypothetical protein n=1 Tax=Rhizobium sp. TaxID=391 RepID=UPI0028AD317A
MALKSLILSVVLTSLAPFATAYFALKNGFRVPIEGVPYIKFALTIWSISALIIAVGALAGLWLIIEYVRNLLRFTVGKLGKFSESFQKTQDRLPYGYLLIATAFLILALLLLLFRSKEPLDLTTISSIGVYDGSLIFSFLLSVTGFAMWFANGKYSYLQLQFFLIFPLVVIIASSLFVNDVYGSFLRVIRYGGGIYSTFQLEASADKSVSGYVLIQNDNMIILMEEKTSKLFEIPVNKIQYRETDAGAPWKLPSYSVGKQADYVKVGGNGPSMSTH